ncbi:MAG: hypothetical protein RL693_892 [Verrucomicrobiota bacterium]|jgi:hypothetical protein
MAATDAKSPSPSSSSLPASAVLNTAVLAAYGFHPAKDLLALNQAVATRIEKSEPVPLPNVPLDDKDHLGYITQDCIIPSKP